MTRNLYVLLLGAVALIIVIAAAMRFGSERAQAPAAPSPAASVPAADAPPASDTDAERAPSGAAAPEAAPAAAPGTYTAAEVAQRGTAEQCWTIISGSVYDLTAWISRHPGGSRAILGICGKDGTDAFSRQHGGSAGAQAALGQFRIGALAP